MKQNERRNMTENRIAIRNLALTWYKNQPKSGCVIHFAIDSYIHNDEYLYWLVFRVDGSLLDVGVKYSDVFKMQFSNTIIETCGLVIVSWVLSPIYIFKWLRVNVNRFEFHFIINFLSIRRSIDLYPAWVCVFVGFFFIRFAHTILMLCTQVFFYFNFSFNSQIVHTMSITITVVGSFKLNIKFFEREKNYLE